MKRRLIDDDGIEIRAGDVLHFGYGIPGVGVNAKVIDRDGKLIALTPGHKPPEVPVSYIVKNFNCWVQQPKRPKVFREMKAKLGVE
jgi:hypothetical protein